MGEVADYMIRGFCCSKCGVPFVDPHEYSVLCKACYRKQAKSGTLRHERMPCAVNEEIA